MKCLQSLLINNKNILQENNISCTEVLLIYVTFKKMKKNISEQIIKKINFWFFN